ncbi:Tetraspanin-15-like protein [Drosera capensis]
MATRQEEPQPRQPPEQLSGSSAGIAQQSAWTSSFPKKSAISGALSLLTFVVSLPILAAVIWLIYMGDYNCEQLVKLPKLRVSIIVCLALVFVLSNLVVFFRMKFAMPGFIVVMVPLITMFLVGLAIIGGYRLQSRAIMGSPSWLKMKVNTDENWVQIKSCIYDTRACDDVIVRSMRLKPYEFTMDNFSPIESGCCEPPSICGMDYVNATYWKKRDDPPYEDKDCDAWENDRTVLCFNCQACRDGFFDTIYGKWWRLGVFLVTMSIVLMASHLLMFLSTMLERYG